MNIFRKISEKRRQKKSEKIKAEQQAALEKQREKNNEYLAQLAQNERRGIYSLKNNGFNVQNLYNSINVNTINDFIRATKGGYGELIAVNNKGESVAVSADSKAVMTSDSFNQYLGGSQADEGSSNPYVNEWFVKQGFIPFQISAIYAQHWLINKACMMPADDCVRNGVEYTINTTKGEKEDILQIINQCEKRFKIKENMRELVFKGRMFGVRIAIFLVESDDPEYYEKPFNPDSILPGTFRGITQVDPYWAVPQLSIEAATDPTDKDFYEPTWWSVATTNLAGINKRSIVRIHRSHLCIFRHAEVADILKPAYIYGGLSLPQLMVQRVYAAERVANEAPMLAMCKRLLVYKMNLAQAFQDQGLLAEKLNASSSMMNNYGIQAIDASEDITQLETQLNEFSDLMNGQWYLNSAISGIPITKLFGTSPPGFQSTGEFELKSYHETLGTIAEKHLIPFLEKFLICIIKSEINHRLPDNNQISIYDIDVDFEPFDIPNAKETADIRKTEAETDMLRLQSYSVTREEVRKKIAQDRNSGYNGIDINIDPEKVDGEEEFLSQPNIGGEEDIGNRTDG